MSKSSYTQYNRKNWEDADFPILCQTCLGSNPYLRMVSDFLFSSLDYFELSFCLHNLYGGFEDRTPSFLSYFSFSLSRSSSRTSEIFGLIGF